MPLADKSVQAIITSPPYYSLRSYGGQTSVWGGDPECEHDWTPVSRSPAQQGGWSEKQASNKGAWHHGTDVTTCTRCGAWRGELGSEPTPALFVAHLVEVFREAWRVLRDDGCVFLNMGDSYGGSTKGASRGPNSQLGGSKQPSERMGFSNQPTPGRPKSLLLVPERLSLALAGFSTVPGAALVQMADELATARESGDWHMVSAVESQLRIWAAMSAVFDGWVVRSRIAWCKAAPMPESVDDRPTSAWEHIWQLTKSNKALFWTHRDGVPGTRTQPAPDYRWRKDGVELTEEPEDAKENGWKRVNLWRGHDYYWDADAVKQPQSEGTLERFGNGQAPRQATGPKGIATERNGVATGSAGILDGGANMRNFWLLGPDPYPGSHFATFPREIPRRCILAATSEYGACAACGAAWKREIQKESAGRTFPGNGLGWDERKAGQNGGSGGYVSTTTTGWAASCKCGPAAGVRPCVVLDPFSGSGTTAFVAASLGRVGIGVELSEAYTKQARYGRLQQQFLPLAAPEPVALRLPFDAEVPG